jgi:hypothetical protein
MPKPTTKRETVTRYRARLSYREREVEFETYEILQETEKTVLILAKDWNGRPRERRAYKSSIGPLFATEAGALADLIEDLRHELDNKEREASAARERLFAAVRFQEKGGEA